MTPRAGLSRRGFLGLLGTAAAAGLGATAGCGISGISGISGIGLPRGQTGEVLRSAAPLPAPYTVALPIPPVARPVRRTGGVTTYEITQRVAEQEILPGIRTPVWGYDGMFPGPTIETRRGEPVLVRHRNELPVPTVVHLHGGHTPAADDGWPLDLVTPAGAPHGWLRHGMTGELADTVRGYRYPSDQRAATLWYHDHRMDFTAPAVYRGLLGLHLVRDEVEDALPLPHDEREIPLLLTDRSFAADGSFAYPSLDRSLRELPGVEADWVEGVLGDVVLVNGAPWPVHETDAARHRLRIVNAANARRFRLVFRTASGVALPIVQIGSDAGLLAAPVSHTALDIAPGERFDVVVDLALAGVGTDVTVENELGAGTTRDVARLRVVRAARDDSHVPDRLDSSDGAVVLVAPDAVTREFVFGRGPAGGHRDWTINGATFDPTLPLAEVALGVTERWRFRTDVHHPVHLHLDPFQVLARGAKAPAASDSGWKDTVDVRPGEVVDVAVRFHDHPGRYVLHCHNLEHEDMAMMATLAIG